jgi:gamma-glutamyltranspeptidase
MTRTLGLACPDRRATAAGEAAFAAGGNALDAALAAATTLAVTYPHNCGAGGDLFAVIRRPGRPAVALNASGPAARGVSADEQRTRGPVMPATGPDPITVPGAVAGWGRLHALGAVLPWADAFAPAIALAQDGFPVAGTLATALAEYGGAIAADPGMAGVFDGRERVRQPALARTFEAIAQHGPREAYEGDTAARLAAGLQRRGSRIDATDLAAFHPEETAPLTARFRGLDLLTTPPNSSGVLLLQALAALERAGAPDPLGADAGRLARLFRGGMAQRAATLADPRHAPFDREAWLGDAQLDALVRHAVGGAPARRAAGDTIGLAAADDSGLGVSLIQSLFGGFGAHILEPETGILLHCRGAAFSLEPGHPNELAPGKRPAHTLLPLVVERDGALQGVLGTMGGQAHPQFLAQVLLRLLGGDDPQTAVARPRWVLGGLDPDRPDTLVQAEPGIADAAVDALTAAGFDVTTLPGRSEQLGHTQAVWELRACSDPRADGHAP